MSGIDTQYLTLYSLYMTYNLKKSIIQWESVHVSVFAYVHGVEVYLHSVYYCTFSITTDPDTLWESDKRRKRHIQKRLEGQLRLRAVAVYSKVVRRRKPSSAEGKKGLRALEGYHSTLSLGPNSAPPPIPRFCFNF